MKTYNSIQFALLRLKAINLKDIAILSAALVLLQVMLVVMEVTSKGVLMGLMLLVLVKIVQGVIDVLSDWMLKDEPKDI